MQYHSLINTNRLTNKIKNNIKIEKLEFTAGICITFFFNIVLQLITVLNSLITLQLQLWCYFCYKGYN